MSKPRTYRVKRVASIAGVSVRTLHYYDQLGLLVPSDRTRAGHRLYTDDDLLRLQQIVIQRELGFSLEEIRKWLDDPEHDRRSALLDQRRALEQRAERTGEMLRSVDRALQALGEMNAMETLEPQTKGPAMTVDMTKLFDGFDPTKHDAEAESRWGDTEAYRVAKERTGRYTEADWSALKAEQAAIYRDAAQAQQAGKSPDDDAVMDIAERHRQSIERWFYPCSPEAHAGLADLYDADPRFARSIDKHGEGLTPFLSAAIRANTRRGRE